MAPSESPSIPLPAGFSFYPDFLSAAEAQHYFETLHEQVQWQRDSVSLFGKSHPIPRLHQWYADPGVRYRWSGLDMEPLIWLAPLSELRERLAAICDTPFNSVLVNLYRDGNDSMGWHADNEPELGPQPVVASLNLGVSRDFQLRRTGTTRVDRSCALPGGSLLLMAGTSQHDWQHAVPKRKRVTGARINLTFRWVN